MRKNLAGLGLVFILGCATSQPLLQSYGSPSLSNFNAFQLVNLSPANTPTYLRDNEILQRLGFQLLGRGYQFKPNPKEAQYLFTVDFVDQVSQVYVPPVTRIQTVSLPDTTSNFSGSANYVYNPFNTIQYSGTATTTGRTTAVATTTGGYYVSQYGVGVAINIYDAKTGELVWSGLGGERAKPTDPVAAANRIVDSILDKKLLLRPKIPADKINMVRIYAPISADSSNINHYGDWKLVTEKYEFLVRITDPGFGLEAFFMFKNKTVQNLNISINDIYLEKDGQKIQPYTERAVSETIMGANREQTTYRPPQDPRDVNPTLAAAIIRMTVSGIDSVNNNKLLKQRNAALNLISQYYLTESTINAGTFKVHELLFSNEGVEESTNLTVVVGINGEVFKFPFRFKEKITEKEHIERLKANLK